MRIRKLKTRWHKYIFQFDYAPFIVEEVKEIQKQLPDGWKDLSFYKDEDPMNTGWVFSSFDVFQKICDEFDPLVEDDVNEEMDLIKTAIEEEERREKILDYIDKDGLDSTLEVPTKKELFHFQKEAVDFVEKVGGRALIADDMGCGKTAEAIGYAVFKNYSRVLVICPASVKTNWKREIWAFGGVKAQIIEEGKTIKVKDLKKMEGTGWEIIGYPRLLTNFWEYLKNQTYDLIILDEAHYIKNKKAKRTQRALSLLKKAKDILFLTGTPVLNRPAEIYNIFNFIRPMPFWGNEGFAMRYCGLQQDPYGRWDYTGATNLDELKKKMSFMIRREKKDVIKELPDKTIDVIETEMKDWKDYRQILEDFRMWLKENDLSQSAVYAEALTKVGYLKQVVVKNKNLKSIIDNFLENGRKLIIFSQYKSVINELYEEYQTIAVKLTGDTPAKDRQNIIDTFQNREDKRIFLSTLKAGGVGITLTSADTVIFTDLSWTPSDHAQAEDRAYRIGQKNNVNVYYLITPKTLEEDIWKMLKRKETMIKKIMEGEKARKVHIKTLLNNL